MFYIQRHKTNSFLKNNNLFVATQNRKKPYNTIKCEIEAFYTRKLLNTKS